ncbi:MAG: hypothetical protein IJK66_00110 [Bacilli bacterium]|nr:hypothetical protein [Bacilli bacterium]
MKKIILLITILLLCGCNKDNSALKKYNLYIEELKVSEISKEIPFDIVVDISKFTDQEYMYKVIIDNPKEELRDIEALIIHDKYTKDIFPSSGIFDDKYNLIPNNINKDINNVKGIILIGYLPYEEDINITFKLLIKYKDNNNKLNTIIYSTKK